MEPDDDDDVPVGVLISGAEIGRWLAKVLEPLSMDDLIDIYVNCGSGEQIDPDSAYFMSINSTVGLMAEELELRRPPGISQYAYRALLMRVLNTFAHKYILAKLQTDMDQAELAKVAWPKMLDKSFGTCVLHGMQPIFKASETCVVCDTKLIPHNRSVN